MSAPAYFALVMATLLQGSPRVHNDYFPAYIEARDAGKMLLIDFGTNFDFHTVDRTKLKTYVLCRVPLDYRIPVGGKQERLIDAPAFICLQGQPGIAVVNLRDKAHFRETVSILPQRFAVAGYMAVLLDLPAGSLTQRTLTWAFRVQGERPACTNGAADPALMQHADRHSLNQAYSNSMYHSSNFPGSFEIVAQSPAGGSVVDAALNLVNLWRSSPPHWGAAVTPWSRYGLDMQSNGAVWYGTGVFQ
jgi:hypothetical protein